MREVSERELLTCFQAQADLRREPEESFEIYLPNGGGGKFVGRYAITIFGALCFTALLIFAFKY